MDVRGFFVDNWPYKLAAFVLSVLVWWSVTADQERPDQPVRTRLEVGVADSAWAIRGVPSTVTTIFEGRRADLLVLDEPLVTRTIDEAADSVLTLELSPQDVTYDRSLDVRPVAIRPSRVTIELERRTQRRLPVEPVIEMDAPDGFARGRMVVDPDSVQISGPSSLVQAMSAIRTRPLTLSGERETVTRELALDLPAGRTGLRVDRAAVLVTVEVDSIISRTLNVSIEAHGPGANGVRLDPPSVQVTLRGASRLVGRVLPSDIRARVELSEAPTRAISVPVEIELPSDVHATPLADPQRITARPSR